VNSSRHLNAVRTANYRRLRGAGGHPGHVCFFRGRRPTGFGGEYMLDDIRLGH